MPPSIGERALQRYYEQLHAESIELRATINNAKIKLRDVETEMAQIKPKKSVPQSTVPPADSSRSAPRSTQPVPSSPLPAILGTPFNYQAQTSSKRPLTRVRVKDHRRPFLTKRPGFEPYTGSDRQQIRNADHYYPDKGDGYPRLSKEYTMIVKLDVGWTELWCAICGVNASHRGHLAGPRGIARLMINKHKKKLPTTAGLTVADALKDCGKKILTYEEVRSLRARNTQPKMVGEVVHRRKPMMLDRAANEVDEEDILSPLDGSLPESGREMQRSGPALTHGESPATPHPRRYVVSVPSTSAIFGSGSNSPSYPTLGATRQTDSEQSGLRPTPVLGKRSRPDFESEDDEEDTIVRQPSAMRGHAGAGKSRLYAEDDDEDESDDVDENDDEDESDDECGF